MSDHEYNDLVSEAQKVEEALKEFISTVRSVHPDHPTLPGL